MGRFCKAPFIQLSIDPRGSMMPCCRYQGSPTYLKDQRIDKGWNGPEFQKIRSQFLEGEEPTECKSCWKDEASGDSSLRHVINQWAEKESFDSNIAPPPQYYEFKTTNVCNLKCRMCSSFNSSSIAKESETKEIRDFWLSDKLINTHHEAILNSWLSHMKYVMLAGGEPFVNNEIKTIVKNIIAHGYNKDIDLDMVTNGTHWNEDFIAELEKFPDFMLHVSIDDLYERNDYARGNSSFSVIENNLRKFILRFGIDKVRINCTVNWYNIWYIDEILEYTEYFKIPINIAFVNNPSYLDIVNLPDYVKNKINKKYQENNNIHMVNILSRLNLDGVNELETFTEHVIHYDELRTESFFKVFPEWAEVLLK